MKDKSKVSESKKRHLVILDLSKNAQILVSKPVANRSRVSSVIRPFWVTTFQSQAVLKPVQLLSKKAKQYAESIFKVIGLGTIMERMTQTGKLVIERKKIAQKGKFVIVTVLRGNNNSIVISQEPLSNIPSSTIELAVGKVPTPMLKLLPGIFSAIAETLGETSYLYFQKDGKTPKFEYLDGR